MAFLERRLPAGPGPYVMGAHMVPWNHTILSLTAWPSTPERRLATLPA